MPTSAELSGFYHITYLENTVTECASEVREGDQIIRDPLEKSGICSNAVNPCLYRYVVRCQNSSLRVQGSLSNASFMGERVKAECKDLWKWPAQTL